MCCERLDSKYFCDKAVNVYPFMTLNRSLDGTLIEEEEEEEDEEEGNCEHPDFGLVC